MEQITSIPKIQKPVQTVSKDAIHYGYQAFKDISLASSCGLDHKVQPPESPYYRNLPARQIIPFVSIEITEIDEVVAAQNHFRASSQVPVKKTWKSAEECATEMETCYQEWGFQVLRPLTGLSEDDALAIFQTIQPFPYKLKDIQNEIDFGALERIAATEPYMVVYGDYEIDLDPLPEQFKETAEKVRHLISVAAEVAVSKGEDIHTNSEVNLTSYLTTGQGKRRPDPLDLYVYAERGDTLPSLNGRAAATPQPQTVIQTESPEAIAMRQREYEQKQRELDIRERELKLKEGQQSVAQAKPPKVALVPTVKLGDTITIGGQDGTVTANRFGKITVQFVDGTTQMVSKDEI